MIANNHPGPVYSFTSKTPMIFISSVASNPPSAGPLIIKTNNRKGKMKKRTNIKTYI